MNYLDRGESVRQDLQLNIHAFILPDNDLPFMRIVAVNRFFLNTLIPLQGLIGVTPKWASGAVGRIANPAALVCFLGEPNPKRVAFRKFPQPQSGSGISEDQ